MLNLVILKKIQDARKGKFHSELTKIKMSEYRKGRLPLPSDYINLAKGRLKIIGRKQSDIEKKKRADKLCKKIEVDGIIYPSIKNFSEIMCMDRTKVFNRLKSDKYKNYIKL